jgi:hypothetical protein
MSKTFPDLKTDDEVDAWLQGADLTEYDLSEMKKSALRTGAQGRFYQPAPPPACHAQGQKPRRPICRRSA